MILETSTATIQIQPHGRWIIRCAGLKPQLSCAAHRTLILPLFRAREFSSHKLESQDIGQTYACFSGMIQTWVSACC